MSGARILCLVPARESGTRPLQVSLIIDYDQYVVTKMCSFITKTFSILLLKANWGTMVLLATV